MNLNGTAKGGHLGSWIEGRPTPAGMNRFGDRFGLEDGSTAQSRSASNDPVALYCH